MAQYHSTIPHLPLARRSRGLARSKDLRRRPSRREPKRRFILFCEGKKTEPAYFDAIKRLCSSTLISVEVVGGVGVPHTIAKKAVEYVKHELGHGRRRPRSSFEKTDQVWAVFDRDTHPRFPESIALCKEHGVRVGQSNPCFELWLILHERDYNRYEEREKMQAILQDLRPEYDKDGGKVPDCDEMVTRVDQAEIRGASLLRQRRLAKDPYGNPSTTVCCLTREIRDADTHAQRS